MIDISTDRFPDLLAQFEPRMHAFMRAQLDVLEEEAAICPPFPGSAFTTAEFSFGDAPMVTRKDVRDAFHAVRAITILGSFDPTHSATFVVPRDNFAIQCPPGSTFFITSAVKDFFFTNVDKGEKRYLFQQSFHAGVQGWLDCGFQSAAKYDHDATPEEREVIEARLAQRVPFASKLLSRLNEVHV